MADKAHDATDEILAGMESRLSAIYDQAHKEIEKKAAAYFEQFEKLDAQKRKLVDAGKLSEEEYKKWRRNKIMYGKHWTNLKAQLAEEYANVNRTALSYINGQLPEVYVLNYNDIGAELDDKVKGYSFELVDAQTVKNLATKDDTLLPYKYLNGVKDVRWNTQKVNAAVLQGILQGESIPNLAKRLQSVTNMNKVSAIRNARTTITSAECKGRQDSYEKAEQDGIKLKREWIAAIDYRTRHAHRLLDGQLADVDKPFKSELGDIMYPGDPSADPENVYNCRCTIAAKVISIGGVKIEDAIDEDAKQAERRTAQDFYNENAKEFDIQQKMLYNEKEDKRLLQKYKSEFGKNAPRSLANLQEMKYRNPAEWKQYKTYLRSIRSGELTPLTDFDLYKSISDEIDQKLIGITTSNGIKTTGKSDHFIARVIGSVEQKRDGVKIDSVLKALTDKDATVFETRKSPKGKTSQKFRFFNVEVTINPDTGVLIQTNPHSKKGAKNGNNQ